MAASHTHERDTSKTTLVYCGQLAVPNHDARCAVALARALSASQPVDLAVNGPAIPQVLDWTDGLHILPYEPGMAANYARLWNVDATTYAEPLASHNLAWVSRPHHNNVPPPDFQLLGMSDHVVAAIENRWGRLATRLYPTVATQSVPVEKEKIILSVGHFMAPNPVQDHGHLHCIEQFRQLCVAGHGDWQLVLVGGLAPGQAAFYDQLLAAAVGLNIRILANADQSTLNYYLAVASIYWRLEGLSHPDNRAAQGAFPLALVEAAAAGAVPLATHNGAAPEVIRHGYNGFLLESSEQCLELTSSLVQAPSAWAMLSQRARVSGEGWADEAVFTDRLQAVLLGHSAARPPQRLWLEEAVGQDRVCAVVPAFNQAEMTHKCLAVLRELNPDVKIILIDNGSTEDLSTAARLAEESGGHMQRLENNQGLGGALAVAAPHCDRPFVAILHNDVFPVGSGDWLDVLLAEMADPNVGVVGPKLKLADGKTVQFAGWGFSPDNGGMFFHMGDGKPDEPRFNQRLTALGVSSACMICRRELFDPDQGYQLIYSDLDLCIKAANAGKGTIFQPASVLVHQEGMTRNTLSDHSSLAGADRERFLSAYPQWVEQLTATARS